MVPLRSTNVTADYLVSRHGFDALRIIADMIGHAIANGRHDEALDLDRVRRLVVLMLSSSPKYAYLP